MLKKRLHWNIKGFARKTPFKGQLQQLHKVWRWQWRYCLLDSQLKVKKGCKGIGRFLWLKAFDKVTVDSIYYEGNHWYSRTFDFALTGINPEQNAKESFHDVTG